jgi:ribose 5-phosphate isomerase B
MVIISISMKIYVGADHNGFELKARLTSVLKRAGFEVADEGDKQLNPGDDFPQFAERVVRALQIDGDPDSKGILICSSGQGMCMAANRFKGIRAGIAWIAPEARALRNDDDSNILCLPARYITEDEAVNLTEIWLATPFAGALRFKRRIGELDNLG